MIENPKHYVSADLSEHLWTIAKARWWQPVTSWPFRNDFGKRIVKKCKDDI